MQNKTVNTEKTKFLGNNIDKIFEELGLDKVKFGFIGKMKLAKLKKYLKQVLPDDFEAVFKSGKIVYKYSGTKTYKGFFGKDVQIILLKSELDLVTTPLIARVNTKTNNGWFANWFGLSDSKIWGSVYLNEDWEQISPINNVNRNAYTSPWEETKIIEQKIRGQVWFR